MLCVIFGINGSSIGQWNALFNTEDTDVLFGISRAIRSDEWATSTPMALSQYFDSERAFSYFSSVVRGMPTDVFLEYGQPVRDIAVMFRPFHWGYLFLPPSLGLAFYWSGRYIVLFMVSIEMGMLLTKKKKLLSIVYASMILWAPVVQWWFAINGLVEMLIYVQASVLLLHGYLSTRRMIKKWFYALGIMLCAGGFILAMYPAWMIPFGYILLGLIIWVIWEKWGSIDVSKKDGLILLAVGICFVALMGSILYRSWDTVKAIMNTSYPGARFETGGKYGLFLFNYVSNIWYAITGEGTGAANVCDAAQFIDFFPLCYIFPLVVLFRDKKKDKLLIILMIVSIFLEIYIVTGYPSGVARWTLLGRCTPYRVCQVIGFANIILFIRSLALMEKPFSRVTAIVGSILGVGVVLSLVGYLDTDYYNLKRLMVTFIIFFVLFYLSFRYSSQKAEKSFALACVAIMMMSGVLVNPIRRGCDNIYELPVVRAIQKIHHLDAEGKWIVEGLGYPMGNLPIMVGAPTINSTNVYPALDRWEMLDPEKAYMDEYNRYAHIWIYMKQEGEADFSATSSDCLTVNMTLEDMEKIGAKYIFTSNDFTEQYKGTLELLEEINGYRIYVVK